MVTRALVAAAAVLASANSPAQASGQSNRGVRLKAKQSSFPAGESGSFANTYSIDKIDES